MALEGHGMDSGLRRNDGGVRPWTGSGRTRVRYTYVKTNFETVQMNGFPHKEVPYGPRYEKLGLD